MIVIGGDTRISCSGVYAGWPYYIPCGGGPAPGGAREKVILYSFGDGVLLFIPQNATGVRVNGFTLDESAFVYPLFEVGVVWDSTEWRGLFAFRDSAGDPLALWEALMAGQSYAALPTPPGNFGLVATFAATSAEIEIDRGQGWAPCDVYPLVVTTLDKDVDTSEVTAYLRWVGPFPGTYQVEDSSGVVLETQNTSCTAISADGVYVIDLTPFTLLDFDAGHRLRAVTSALNARWNNCASVTMRSDDPGLIGGGET